ncbi:MAG: type II toxin-antitoxin system death-on-curing family toxin, partial [Halobacteriales archaeon]
ALVCGQQNPTTSVVGEVRRPGKRRSDQMADSLWYPSVEDVIGIHEDIVSEYPETESGIRTRGDVAFALEYVSDSGVGPAQQSIHHAAFHLLRLLVANHPFADANKRTALNTVVVFYFLNGYRFEYADEIRELLRNLGTDETTVDETETVEYLRSHTEPVELPSELDEWREDLVQYGLDQLIDEPSDPND